MKSAVLFISLSLSSLSVFASTKDLECVGDLTKNDFSRRSHLVFNDETKQLEGYKGSIETGGIAFSASQLKDRIVLKMIREENSKEVVIASAKLPMDSDMRLAISLEEGFEASLVCFKK
ncbi:MAG: hypothetical protein ACXVLQ_00420 [Bacteriovorax sp.]